MRERIKQAKRIVIKVGTSSLILPNGNVNLRSIDELAFTLSALRGAGYEVILVSSGAMGAGLHQLNYEQRPAAIPEQQAISAVGQLTLMNIYNQRFQSYNQLIGQVLITRDVIDYPQSRQNVRNTLEQLISLNCVPIINENDTVSLEELDHTTKFGDNDELSSIVCNLIEADVLIMLSDIDGFYSDNPKTNVHAELFSEIQKINDKHYALSGGKGSRFGKGGMRSKLRAAERVMEQGRIMVLANGTNPSIISKVLAGEKIGTVFGAAE